MEQYEGDLLVVNVVLYHLHVRNTSVLSSSCPLFRVVSPCCCRTLPNQGEWVQVIVGRSPVLFRKTKGLSDSHPCFCTQYRCCCKKKPKKYGWEKVIFDWSPGLSRKTKGFRIITYIFVHNTDVAVGSSQILISAKNLFFFDFGRFLIVYNGPCIFPLFIFHHSKGTVNRCFVTLIRLLSQ